MSKQSNILSLSLDFSPLYASFFHLTWSTPFFSNGVAAIPPLPIEEAVVSDALSSKKEYMKHWFFFLSLSFIQFFYHVLQHNIPYIPHSFTIYTNLNTHSHTQCMNEWRLYLELSTAILKIFMTTYWLTSSFLSLFYDFQVEGYTFCMRMWSPAQMRMCMSSGPYWWNPINLKLHQNNEAFQEYIKAL